MRGDGVPGGPGEGLVVELRDKKKVSVSRNVRNLYEYAVTVIEPSSQVIESDRSGRRNVVNGKGPYLYFPTHAVVVHPTAREVFVPPLIVPRVELLLEGRVRPRPEIVKEKCQS